MSTQDHHFGHHQEPDSDEVTTGVHGMLLVGSDPFYLSHLPMFGSPHNFQVILEVRFDDTTSERLRDEGDGLMTFEPVEFPLAELDPQRETPSRSTIEGDLYRGHFERVGEILVPGVAAGISNVTYFNELDVDASHDAAGELMYLCFGPADQLHLAHRISAAPDFDQVLDVSFVPGTVTDAAGRPGGGDVTTGFENAVPVTVRDRSDVPASRLVPGETANGFFFASVGPNGSHGFAVDLAAGPERYLELRELGSEPS